MFPQTDHEVHANDFLRDHENGSGHGRRKERHAGSNGGRRRREARRHRRPTKCVKEESRRPYLPEHGENEGSKGRETVRGRMFSFVEISLHCIEFL